MKTAKTLNWITFGLGVWEVLSAFVFMRWTVPIAFWNAFVAGALILLLSIVAERSKAAKIEVGLGWAIVAVGLWLVISPFMFAYDVLMPIAMWNDVIVGAVTLVLTLRVEAVLHKEIPSEEEIASEQS